MEKDKIYYRPSDVILRLEYRREFFDITQMKPGGRKVTVITDDGSIVIKEYESGNRKPIAVKKKSCTKDEYNYLCQKLLMCIADADQQDFYVDDSSEELKLYHPFGREQTIDRGLGNSESNIGEIMTTFLERL